MSAVSLVVAIATFLRVGLWRRQDRAEADPKFQVLVQPFGVVHRGSEEESARLAGTGRVLVTIQNFGTEDATANHACLALHGQMDQRTQVGPEEGWPIRLEARGGQVSWSISGEKFDSWMGGDGSEDIGNGLRRQKFTVYVGMDPWTDLYSTRIWHSRLFSVERPYGLKESGQ